MALLSHSLPTQLVSPVNFVPKNAPPRHDGAVQATSGEFAGWGTWTRDNFELHNGPFWHREEDNGAIRCAFRLGPKHIHRPGAGHDAPLISLAASCMFPVR